MPFPWGVSLGTQNCVVAIARKGGIDVIDNEASSRKTPCMVGLGGKERAIGEAAKAKITSNILHTVTELKSLIGKRWAEEEIQALKDKLPFKMKEDPSDGGIFIELNYEKDGGELQATDFTPEQLLGMLLKNLKLTAEAHNKGPSPDAVISVPCFFNDSQRRAVLDAAEIAGVKCLRLMNETAAVALNWGLPKSMDLPEESAPPKHVLFFDMGYNSTQVCIVAFHKSKMTVLASAFDRTLGGKTFDEYMINHFAKEWKTKTGLDLLTNPKALYRLSVQVDKVKQQLSGYTSSAKLPVNVECLQDDRDFASFIDTDTWWDLTRPLLERALAPVKQVINESKLTFDQIDEVEVVGSATRSPMVTNTLKDFLGKEPKRTMNSEEAVAKGCALQAAMISPNFRVRDFSILDSTPYAISLHWTSDSAPPQPPDQGLAKRARVHAVMHPEQGDAMDVEGEGTKGSVVFTQHNVIPSFKMLTFMRTNALNMSAVYAEPAQLSKGMPTQIASFGISNIPPGPDGGPTKVKVKVRLDHNGVLSLDSVQSVEEVEATAEEEAKKEDDVPMADAPPAAPAGDAPAEQPAAGEGEEKKEAVEEKKKKPKVKKTDLPVVFKVPFKLPDKVLEQFKTSEFEMETQDRHIKELQEKKNDLETYIYNMRDRCSAGDLKDYISQADKDKFMPMLDAMENWLYEDEAEHANKSTFVSKLDELKKFGQPALERAREADERPMAFAELEKTINEYQTWVGTTDEAYAHITPEERQKVSDFVATAAKWLSDKKAEQGSKAPHEPLVVTSGEVRTKKNGLTYDCNVIKNKAKPAPPKPEPKADDKKDDKKADAPPAEGAPAGDAAGGAPPASGEAMDEALD